MPLYALGEHTPDIADSVRSWIAPDAHVIGRVRLGLDVSIWFGAVLRGDHELIELGDKVNVQEGAVLHVDPGFPLRVEDGVTIGHSAIVHGCTIGAGSLIGMGATVLNGVRIGRGCLVGANALLTEGKEFPDGSLIVGSPAKAIRQLDAKAIEGMLASAENYVCNGQRFRTSLRRID